MNAIPWKRLLPVFAALALFYTLSLVYFSPVLEGKRLVQGDIKNWQGMAQEVEEHRTAFDEEPLWTGSMFSGMPAYQIYVKWPNNLLLKVDKVFRGFLPRPADFLFLYLMGMFILLLCLNVDPWLAIVGAVAFGFSSYFFVILEAGHTSKANAIGYMPMVLGAMHLLYRRRLLLGGALLALFMGLEVSTNHVQVTYYLGMLLLLYALAEGVRAVREGQVADYVKRSSIGIVAVGLGLACNIGMLWTTYEYGKETTRGKGELTILADGSSAEDIRTEGLDRDYITDWSYGKAESLTLLVPNAMGGATGALGGHPEALSGLDQRFRQSISQMNSYWGEQRFTSGPVYLGAIVVLLMLLMLVRTEGHGRWWLLASVPVIAAMIMIEAPLMAGGLLLLYLLAGLWAMKDTLAYALFSALVLTLLLSWGRNLMPLTDFFLDLVPGYDKFRAVTIILVIVELAAPVLAILYLDRMIREGAWTKAVERKSLIVIASVITLLLAMAVLPSLFSDFISENERVSFNAQIDEQPAMEAQVVAAVEQLKQARQNLFTADAWRSLGFVVVAGILLLLFGRGKVGKPVFLVGIGALILLDLWVVDKRYVNNEKDRGTYLAWEDPNANKYPFQPNAADKAILEGEWNPAAEKDLKATLDRLKSERQGESGRDRMVLPEEEMLARFAALRRNTDYRVMTLSNPFQDSRVSYFHKSVGGYHGAKLKRYQDLIEFHLGPAAQRAGGLLQSGTSLQGMDSLLASEGVLNMLNTRYLIYSPERPPIRNVNALGSAWFVDNVKWVKDADAEIMAIGEIDPATTVVVDERYRSALGDASSPADPSANVELEQYRTNALTYSVNSGSGGVVVFSEIWYGPDWQATIDGKPVEYARANYVLRALRVPPGKHEVVFSVVGNAFHTSQMIALASSGLLLLLVIGVIIVEVRRPREEREVE